MSSTKKTFTFLFIALVGSNFFYGQEAPSAFLHTLENDKKPWTIKPFYNNPKNFQFAIVSDRTGGHREGVFGKGVEKINQLYPEFVMSVGDLIEGYTKNDSLINEQWDEFHGLYWIPYLQDSFMLPVTTIIQTPLWLHNGKNVLERITIILYTKMYFF